MGSAAFLGLLCASFDPGVNLFVSHEFQTLVSGDFLEVFKIERKVREDPEMWDYMGYQNTVQINKIMRIRQSPWIKFMRANPVEAFDYLNEDVEKEMEAIPAPPKKEIKNSK